MITQKTEIILVSGSHGTGDPHEVHFACGVLKQVIGMTLGIKSFHFPFSIRGFYHSAWQGGYDPKIICTSQI